MFRFIDVSNHQGRAGMDLSRVLPSVGGVVCKATEGVGFVDAYCDRFVQTCRAAGKPWGFYHFAGENGASAEAAFFLNSTSNYFGEGIPILDWEGNQSVAWVNEFVRVIHDQTGVWPWVYANPWRFNQGGVEPNCMRWVAQYPGITTFAQAEKSSPAATEGGVGAWQFTSSGHVNGYSGNLDCNLFYGDTSAWSAYVKGDNVSEERPTITPVENAVYRLYNPNDGLHHFTANVAEASALVEKGWVYEGAPISTKGGTVQQYALYNPFNGAHLITSSTNEAVTLACSGWTLEGYAFKTPKSGTKFYRLYNPSNGDHLYTCDTDEVDACVAAGWTEEGLAFYGAAR